LNFTNEVKFDQNGLVPCIVEDYKTGETLMMAYMNAESIEKTLETSTMWFYSRSRQALWNKGETSGNYQKVKEFFIDCDGDTLLAKVEPMGPACHTGHRSCFYRRIEDGAPKECDAPKKDEFILDELCDIVRDRMENPKEDSYTNYLLDCGIDKILKKVGEECSETIIAAKNADKKEIAMETSDLLYHLTVMLVERGMDITDVYKELRNRR